MTTSAVSSVAAAPLFIEVAPVTKFSKIDKTDLKSRMSRIAQTISSVVSNAINSIKETFNNLKHSFSNAVNSLVNRVQALFKKEEVKAPEAAPASPVEVAPVKEVVVSLPDAPAPWYAKESLKSSALSVKTTVARVLTAAKDATVSVASAATDRAIKAASVARKGISGATQSVAAFSKQNKKAILIGIPAGLLTGALAAKTAEVVGYGIRTLGMVGFAPSFV